METLFLLVILAVLTETIWGRIKEAIPEHWNDKIKKVINLTGTSVLGVLICLLVGMDIFEMLGFSTRWLDIGIILTGLIIGGGSNLVHDLMRKLRPEE